MLSVLQPTQAAFQPSSNQPFFPSNDQVVLPPNHFRGKENLAFQSDIKSTSDQLPHSSKLSSQSVPQDELKKSLTCGICSSWIASSLVLSCGHVFCGHCLFEYLSSKPSCPTCQVGMRAIPVRCLALDGVGATMAKVMSKKEFDDFKRREEDGKAAANKVNKMFWWLAPTNVPVSSDSGDKSGTGILQQQQQQSGLDPALLASSMARKMRSSQSQQHLQPQQQKPPQQQQQAYRSRGRSDHGAVPQGLAPSSSLPASFHDFQAQSLLQAMSQHNPFLGFNGAMPYSQPETMRGGFWPIMPEAQPMLPEPSLNQAQLQQLLQQLYLQGTLS